MSRPVDFATGLQSDHTVGLATADARRAYPGALRRVRDGLIPEGADSDLIVACYTSRDFKEGVEAFLAKRKPVWTGE